MPLLDFQAFSDSALRKKKRAKLLTWSISPWSNLIPFILCSLSPLLVYHSGILVAFWMGQVLVPAYKSLPSSLTPSGKPSLTTTAFYIGAILFLHRSWPCDSLCNVCFPYFIVSSVTAEIFCLVECQILNTRHSARFTTLTLKMNRIDVYHSSISLSPIFQDILFFY